MDLLAFTNCVVPESPLSNVSSNRVLPRRSCSLTLTSVRVEEEGLKESTSVLSQRMGSIPSSVGGTFNLMLLTEWLRGLIVAQVIFF